MNLAPNKFEDAVREYINGSRDWQSVHNLAVQMEWTNDVNFPAETQRPMEELQMIFLPDEKDDPQFRADRDEIARLLDEVDRLKSAAKTLGPKVVADCERTLQEAEEQDRRKRYMERRKRHKKSND